jgi:hypothetical protein
MMNQLTEWIRGAALAMPSLSELTDRFLDWIEELGAAMAPAPTDGLVRVRILLD